MTGPLRALHARRHRRQFTGDLLPGHVGLIMGGNRRGARRIGMANPSPGHRCGAEHAEDVLSWCEAVGIRHVTLFVCPVENLQRRDDAEVPFLMQVIEDVVATQLARPGGHWEVHLAGTLDALPDATVHALKRAVEATRDCSTGAQVTLAIGYGFEPPGWTFVCGS